MPGVCCRLACSVSLSVFATLRQTLPDRLAFSPESSPPSLNPARAIILHFLDPARDHKEARIKDQDGSPSGHKGVCLLSPFFNAVPVSRANITHSTLAAFSASHRFIVSRTSLQTAARSHTFASSLQVSKSETIIKERNSQPKMFNKTMKPPFLLLLPSPFFVSHSRE